MPIIRTDYVNNCMWSMPGCVGSSRAELGHEQSALYESWYTTMHGHMNLKSDRYFYINYDHFCGLGSVVGIATVYGLDGPGVESRWGRDFPHLSRPALRPTQPLVQWVPGLSQCGWGMKLNPQPF